MLKRCYTLILIIFLLAACANQRQKMQPSPAVPSGAKQTQYRSVKPFTQLDARGVININLHTGYKKPQVILTGDPRDLAQVKTIVSQNTLYVNIGQGYPQFGPVSADIRGRYLNRFLYKGAGLITGSQLHTSVLDLSLENQGTTRLGGSIGLRTLEVQGKGLTQISGLSSQNLQMRLRGNPKVQLSGLVHLSDLLLDENAWLSLYWVKSDYLIIRAQQNAKIQLAGAVNRLEVELWGHAQFKGRYLRARRSFVKTHGRSVAEISAVNHQSDLATDASDIYYFNMPNTRADFMAYNGSVLDMREWDQADLQDFNRYNHQYP